MIRTSDILARYGTTRALSLSQRIRRHTRLQPPLLALFKKCLDSDTPQVAYGCGGFTARQPTCVASQARLLPNSVLVAHCFTFPPLGKRGGVRVLHPSGSGDSRPADQLGSRRLASGARPRSVPSSTLSSATTRLWYTRFVGSHSTNHTLKVHSHCSDLIALSIWRAKKSPHQGGLQAYRR